MGKIHNNWRAPKSRVRKSVKLARQAAAQARLQKLKKNSRRVSQSVSQPTHELSEPGTSSQIENPAQPVTGETPEDHLKETSTFQRKVEYFDGQNFATQTGDEYIVSTKT